MHAVEDKEKYGACDDFRNTPILLILANIAEIGFPTILFTPEPKKANKYNNSHLRPPKTPALLNLTIFDHEQLAIYSCQPPFK